MNLFENLKKDLEEKFGIDSLAIKDKSKNHYFATHIFIKIVDDRFGIRTGKRKKKYKDQTIFLKDLIRYTGLTYHTLTDRLCNFDFIIKQYPDIIPVYRELRIKYADSLGDLDFKLNTINEELQKINSSMSLINNLVKGLIDMQNKNLIHQKDEWDE